MGEQQGSKAAMLDFVGTTITQSYVDCQPELLTILKDELKLEWSAQPLPTNSCSGGLSEAEGSAEVEADRNELVGANSKGVSEVRGESGLTPESVFVPFTVVSSERTKLNPKHKKKKKHKDMDPMASPHTNKSVEEDNVEEKGEAIVDSKKPQP